MLQVGMKLQQNILIHVSKQFRCAHFSFRKDLVTKITVWDTGQMSDHPRIFMNLLRQKPQIVDD